MNKTILIQDANTGSVTVIAGLSIDEAKAGQKKILAKLPEGTATVTIGESVTLEEYMESLK